MKRGRTLAILLAAAVILGGCAALVVGTGAGVGVYSYIEGELRRAYPNDVQQTLAACRDTLAQLQIRIENQTSDGIQTTLQAKRPDGTPVTVKVTMLSPRVTEVGVRSGVIGLWDKQISELIHTTIAQRLA
jgi:hypothetical protein